MKRMAVLFFFVISFFSLYAETLTGFWGIPWGTPISEIETRMTEKGYQPSAKTSNGYIYQNVLFAGRNGDVFFVLKDARLTGGSFRFIPKKDTTYDSYQSLKNDLIDKYGAPSFDKEDYLSPFRKGDGSTESAIVMNRLKLSTAWEFEDKNLILLGIESDDESISRFTISLNYYVAAAIAEKRQSVLEDL